MRLLILGGTAWLGRRIAAEALARGHRVSCLARGDSGSVPTAAEFVSVDRDQPGAYAAVTAESWDAVLDLTRQPGHARRAVTALEPVAERYLFVSSVSAYADHRAIGQQEDAARLPPLEADVMTSMGEYGSAKVACEDAVTASFGADRSLIARLGLIGGPGDWSGRSGYWPWRFARPSTDEGAVLVPDAPDQPVAVLDVGDCAGWLVDCAAGAVTGVFDVAGEVMPLADHLAAARRVASHTGELVAVPGEWLTDHGVASWAGPRSLPLWLADRSWHGMNARDTSRARAAGLRTRPLTQTLSDALGWELARSAPGPHGAGLTDDQERELIASFRAGPGQSPK